jgi:hypothetical protein
MKIHRLGKLPPVIDNRTLQMARYRAVLPSIPPEVSWMAKVPANWGMMLNDNLGDCTCAAAGHMIEQWTTYAGSPVTPSDAAILKAYEAVSGYTPSDPSTDNGAAMLDVLNYWRQTGIGGHKIFAYVQLNPLNPLEVRQAVQLFGNVYMGVQLPLSAQGENAWTVPPGGTGPDDGVPGGWGGHAVPIVAVSPQSLTCVTWGSTLKMSHNFFTTYCDELYAIVSVDWIEKNGLSPSQFNLAQLEKDLAVVTA